MRLREQRGRGHYTGKSLRVYDPTPRLRQPQDPPELLLTAEGRDVWVPPGQTLHL